jgi:hypothetical protein
MVNPPSAMVDDQIVENIEGKEREKGRERRRERDSLLSIISSLIKLF